MTFHVLRFDSLERDAIADPHRPRLRDDRVDARTRKLAQLADLQAVMLHERAP